MGFGNYYQISVDRTKCGTSNLSNYPVMVFISNANFKDRANGGLVQNNTTGYDIVFSTDSLGASLIPWEVEFYDNVNGIIWAHVFLTTVNGSAAGSNSSIYVCFNNGAISTKQNVGSFASTAVWNSGYKGVWHLADVTTGGTTVDSTSNGNNGSASATSPTSSSTGQIGKCANFDGNTARNIDVGSSTTLGGLAAFTISGWIKPSGFGDDTFSTIFCIAKQRSAPLDPFQDVILAVQSGTIFLAASSGVAGSRKTYNPATTLTTGNWYYIVGVYDGANLNTYKNGTIVGAGTACTVTTPGTPSQSARIGQMGILPNDFAQVNGLLDEVRVSNTNRSADWILTEYNNQNAPGNIGANNFLIFGSLGANVYPDSWSPKIEEFYRPKNEISSY